MFYAAKCAFKIVAVLVRENIMAFVFSMAYENALKLDL
jgi:hypothetical protein